VYALARTYNYVWRKHLMSVLLPTMPLSSTSMAVRAVSALTSASREGWEEAHAFHLRCCSPGSWANTMKRGSPRHDWHSCEQHSKSVELSEDQASE
jgi:hypothetical protein